MPREMKPGTKRPIVTGVGLPGFPGLEEEACIGGKRIPGRCKDAHLGNNIDGFRWVDDGEKHENVRSRGGGGV